MIRVNDYQSLMGDLASALHFPWVSSTPLGANQSYAAAQASLVASVNTWATASPGPRKGARSRSSARDERSRGLLGPLDRRVRR